jgi:hypothetical protein
MGKRILILGILPVLVLALAGVAQAWQGRMSGMEDPYGLVQDESDFLIHPAKIANGDGVRFYGDYSFTYTGVPNFNDLYVDYTSKSFYLYRSHVSGEETEQNGLVGTSFPLGTGRMGVFVTYDGMRSSFDGGSSDTGGTAFGLDIKNNFDNVALRLLYGLPIGGGFKLGGEAQLAYNQEQQRLVDTELEGLGVGVTSLYDYDWYPYPEPSNANYWEALFKGSLEGKVGPLDVEFTLRGGVDFGGTSKWNFEYQEPLGTPLSGWDTKDGVKGFQFGEDLWLRYPLAAGLTLPFLVRVDYRTLNTYEYGPGWGLSAGEAFSSKDMERNLTVTFGGGLDREVDKATRVAAGIYFSYIQNREEFFLFSNSSTFWESFANTYPNSTEHQALLRLAGEHTLSPTVALRAGLSLFVGWVDPRESFYSLSPIFSDTGAESGHGFPHWGIGASLGGTIKVKAFTLEPFVNAGWQQYHLGMQGAVFDSGIFAVSTDEKIDENQWYAGAGLSILFDL